ncbi:MAG: hypothetical protein RID93_06925, partial [Sandaracinaceae bacterium]
RVCAPGLRCNWEARCAPDAAGLECGRSLDCPPALSCVDERCAAPAERCDHDEACGVGEACRDGRCQGVERCRLDGECGRERRCGGEVVERCGIEPPEPWLLPDGEPCDHTAGCREGLVCDGRCAEAPETLGAVCADGRCGGGLVCRVGRCVAPGARVGAACVPYDRNACGPRLACVWARDRDGGVAARCAHAPAIGARCPEGRCAGGAECLPYVVDGRCEPLFCEPGTFWICEID